MSEEPRALVPLQERQVDFYGDNLLAVLVEEDEKRWVYVPIRPIVEYLGLAWSSQLQRIKRDEDLAEGLRGVLLLRAEVGQRYEVSCLRLEYLPGFLFGITTSKVREDLRPQVRRYKRECYRVLWEAFQRGELFGDDDELPAPPGADTIVIDANAPLAVTIAEEQHRTLTLLQEHDQSTSESLNRVESKLDHAVGLLADFFSNQQARIDKIDERTAHLTPKHAQQVQDEVSLLVRLWRARRPDLSEEQAKSWAYSHIHQQFQAPSYKEIADERFGEVMTFIRKAIRRASRGQYPEQASWLEQP